MAKKQRFEKNKGQLESFVLIVQLFAIIVVTFIAYAPALNGKPVWDDEAHITKPELRSMTGLANIWFKLGATQQYYPVVHSVFWLEHALWGDAYLGYHLVNVLLHAASACLLAVILRKLRIPGALLAAAIFALHPVNVESVAWMSELKNTLSTVFYLTAALIYLRFDESRNQKHYLIAFALFLLGLMSKSVIATLPGALLVVMWWQRGSVSLKRDVLPLIPLFVVGAASGLFTAWVERKFIGAEGDQFTFTILQRLVLSGHVIWFYLGKLFWPTNLMFVYPRWDLNALHLWDYLYTPAAIWVIVMAAILAPRWRGPLAALLLFAGSLFPVLGFFNVFPFVYSFVADHFQYLACMAIFVLVSACIAKLLKAAPKNARIAGQTACVLMLLMLGALTWNQSQSYRDAETLYRVTLAKNPDCWLAHNNLSVILRAAGRVPEAMQHSKEAIDLNPKNPASHNNMSLLLSATGDIDEAIHHAREAIRLNPKYPEAHNNLGAILAGQGDLNGARVEYAEAARLEPLYAQAHANLGRVLFLQGDKIGANKELQTALRLDTNNPQAHYTLAQILKGDGDFRAALPHYRRALELQARWPGPLRDLQQIAESSADASVRADAHDLYVRFSR